MGPAGAGERTVEGAADIPGVEVPLVSGGGGPVGEGAPPLLDRGRDWVTDRIVELLDPYITKIMRTNGAARIKVQTPPPPASPRRIRWVTVTVTSADPGDVDGAVR